MGSRLAWRVTRPRMAEGGKEFPGSLRGFCQRYLIDRFQKRQKMNNLEDGKKRLGFFVCFVSKALIPCSALRKP